MRGAIEVFRSKIAFYLMLYFYDVLLQINYVRFTQPVEFNTLSRSLEHN